MKRVALGEKNIRVKVDGELCCFVLRKRETGKGTAAETRRQEENGKQDKRKGKNKAQGARSGSKREKRRRGRNRKRVEKTR